MHSVRTNYTKVSSPSPTKGRSISCRFVQADAMAEPCQARRDLCPLIRVGCDPMPSCLTPANPHGAGRAAVPTRWTATSPIRWLP
jgi:hypothetical protein